MHVLSYIGIGLAGIGTILAMIFGIILMVKAFQTSTAWGLVYLFLVGIGPMIFVIRNWEAARKPFLKAIGASAMTGIGCALAMMGAEGREVLDPKDQEGGLRALPETPIEIQSAPQPQAEPAPANP